MRPLAPVLLAIPLCAAAFSGCASILNWSGTPGSATGAAEIVTGGYPEFYLADRIAGGTHSVVLLGKPGASVHDFDPDPSDIATMKSAKLVLLHGMSLEPWGDKAKAAMGAGGPVFNVTAPSPASLGLKDYFPPPPNGDPGLTVDPHTWTDPVGYRAEATNVEAILDRTFPADADTFHANAVALELELTALDQSFRSGLANCDKRVIVTNHDAYFYLGHEYNITTDALHGITPDSDATPQDVQAAITTIQNDHLTVIFLEDGTSPSAVQSIVDQTHVKVDVLTPNEEPPGPGQGDYVARQYGNLVKLENALGCH